MKAYHPVTGQEFFFVDKNLPYGAGISCSIFQRFSNALKHIIKTTTGRPYSCCNYLDDYLFCGPTKQNANLLVRTFVERTKEIGLTVAEEKTEFGTPRIIFLGILIVGD